MPKFKIRYKYIQGKIDTYNVIEFDNLEQAEKWANERYIPDGWNHFVYVDPAPECWELTMDRDGNKIEKPRPAQIPIQFRYPDKKTEDENELPF